MKFRFLNTPAPLTHQGRKHPIQKDEDGKSLRQRCFELFRQGRNVRETSEILYMKLATARRYYSEWNRCPPIFEATYKSLKAELKRKGEISSKIIGMLKEALNMPEWQIIGILSHPNGLKSLLKGKYIKIRKLEIYGKQEQRLAAALELVVDLERTGVPLEWIHREIRNMIQKALMYANTHQGDDQDDNDYDEF
jgi:hypothetical protein